MARKRKGKGRGKPTASGQIPGRLWSEEEYLRKLSPSLASLDIAERDRTRMPIHVPKIVVEKMRALVQAFDHEIGWICTANDTDQRLEIKDLFVFKQIGHGASYDMLPDEFYPWQKSVAFGKEPGVKNGEVRCQGHSHVRMPCTESNRDVKMAEQIFGGRENIYTISIIVNKYDGYEAYIYVHRPVSLKFKGQLILIPDTEDSRHVGFDYSGWIEANRYKFTQYKDQTAKKVLDPETPFLEFERSMEAY